MMKVLDDPVRELWIPQMTLSAFGVQLVVETKCEGLFDVEALDCCRLSQPARELARHRFPFITQSLQNGERKRVL